VRVRRGWDESNVPSTDSAREVTLGRVAVLLIEHRPPFRSAFHLMEASH
jgi:hypothetical protein